MADQKISQLTSLTGANTASGDLVTIVDISDTTMGASGTNKKMTLAEFQASPVSAGTANGVTYLNGSKVLTTGAVLTFDGTNLGVNTATFGTSAAGVLSLGTGTAPTTGPADTVQMFSVDRTAGNTIPAVRCEGSGVTNAGITSTTVTHKIAIQVNGTIYYLLATTNAT
jgi:hypothetical protein